MEGVESQAFAFDADGGAFVVRVNALAGGFEKDRLAHDRFNRAQLPVPEVLLIAECGPLHWYCVSRRVTGDTLQALPTGSAFRYGKAAARLLDALAKNAMDPAAGAGPFDGTGQASFTRWPDYVSSVSGWDWSALPGAQRQSAMEVVGQVCRMANDLPDLRRLVHGDFGSNNVLVQDGVVIGLIDWSEAMIGDPVYDLANLLFWRPWLDCMEQQCRFIEEHESWRLSERDALTCYQLRIGLGVLRDAVLDGDTAMANWSLARCMAIAAG
ncbi:phosphotransferase family protein [Devosia sp. CAU 1758]